MKILIYSFLSWERKLVSNLFLLSVYQAVEAESQELELDLSSLGAVNTMFAALFRLDLFVSFFFY